MRRFTLFLSLLVAFVTTMAQSIDLTFTKVSATDATVAVAGNDIAVDGVTATITANYDWKALNANSQKFPNASILCPDKNTNAMTAGSGAEGIFTITLNNLPAGYSYKNVTFTSVALNGGGEFQGDDVNAQPVNFELTAAGEVVGTIENKPIKVNSNGGESVVVNFEVAEAYPATDGSLELKLKLATTESKGCFYGLIKVSIEAVEVTPEPEPITVVSYSPDVEVILLETIEIEFSEPIATNIPNTSYVECPDGSQQYFLDRTIEGNILRLRITAQTVEGTYKLNIPAGVIKSESGAEYAGGEFTFIISDTSSEDIYIDDVTITPADNSVVNSLDYILFEYPAGSNISFVSSATASVVDADGKQVASPSYTFFTKEGYNYLDINAIAIKFDAIKTPGTYTVTVAEGAFKDNNSSNISPKYVLTYTVEKGEEPEIPTDYTYFEGTNNHDVRALVSFTIADADTEKTMTVENIQVSGGKSPIFVDKTDNVFEVAAGATLYFEEFNWAGEWMHAYAYIDYNNDFIFNTTLNVEGATDGELVSYNSYNDKSSLGDAVSGGSLNAGNYGGSKGLPYFVLPHKIAAGDYRMRIKIDWNLLDPNFVGQTSNNHPENNGACQVDIILRVVEDEPAVDTAIDNVNAEGDKAIYDITGRRVEKINAAGIYIVNGVKVLVK